MMMLLNPEAWLAFVTLTALELVLGIDNIILIALLVDALPERQRPLARKIGLVLAMLMRIVLLLGIAWIMGLMTPLFYFQETPISGRDLILLGGGLFLLWKSTSEIHLTLVSATQEGGRHSRRGTSFARVMVQIILIDQVFSLDSVITAVGMVEQVEIMVAAIVVAVLIMMLVAGQVAEFIQRNPTVKILALSFLLVVGMALIADGLGTHIPRGYIYFAMIFSVFVETLNIRYLRNTVR